MEQTYKAVLQTKMCFIHCEGLVQCADNMKIYKLPAKGTYATASEIQQTAFQQRQAIQPDFAISNNGHVFMYLPPTDNRLWDIKEVLWFQPLFSLLSHLYPVFL